MRWECKGAMEGLIDLGRNLGSCSVAPVMLVVLVLGPPGPPVLVPPSLCVSEDHPYDDTYEPVGIG